ncbi:hypothetical protein A1O7_07151 [Cladophialophora yegresii CBS 114405]|uniref:Uncharacterized protein n=1 Tax=Cladophialophora yegresii CBS 114405 TaxID=1182544 RepID=W9VM85_9EURO|nr:uncharacterized protein A1O7_07151 [Cladophialophora yegresii CBS 114405]EXJ56807.1 hypothetical protein A1O7_07151 [Cladophialophora yegresii CBS 114405]
MVKLKGWLMGSFSIWLALIVSLFSGLLSAGPVRRDDLLTTPAPHGFSSVGVHSLSVTRSSHNGPHHGPHGHFPPHATFSHAPHAAPTHDVKLEAPGTPQLTNLDVDLNNYAINCNKIRRTLTTVLRRVSLAAAMVYFRPLIGTLDSTTIVEKREAEPSPDHAIPAPAEKREALIHDYAIVCYENRATTSACGKAPWLYTCNANGKVVRARYFELCEITCTCVNLYPRPKCPISHDVRVKCDLVDNTIYDDNGTVLGSSTDAVVQPNGTYDLTKLFAHDSNVGDKSETATIPASSTVTHSPVLAATPTNKAAKVSIPVVTKVSAVPTTTPPNTLNFSTPTLLPHENAARSEPEVTLQSLATASRFDVQCAADGKFSQSLTDRCMAAHYTCLRIPIYPLAMLHHTGIPDPECSAQCKCPDSFPKGILADTTNTVHPKPFHPARSDTVQSSDKYKLSCGNRNDGPELCGSADLGYFCTANMTVARNTTVPDNDANWCDASCSCIFAEAVPCINMWGVPRCRELIDGTVRDANNLLIVLAYTGSVTVLANGTLVIDRYQGGYFPFVAAESGFLHDGNGTSVVFPASSWNGTGSVQGESRP